jgi:multidrug efflux pump subunit AcrA (membrane-fusion protein)
MRKLPDRPRGVIRLTLVAALLLCMAGGTFYVWRKSIGAAANRFASAVTVPVEQKEFIASVNESGEVESSSNVEIRCKVKSQGREGATILKVITEGTVVEAGDFLCQLDDSLLKDQLIEQKIQVARDDAAEIQAKSDLATARGMLLEFENGIADQEVAILEAQLALAEEGKKRAADYLTHSQTLNRKGFITSTQLEADEFAVEKANQDERLARQKLSVYKEYTQGRMKEEFLQEIKKQEANVSAAEYTLKLSKQRELEIIEQIANCEITAPSAGTLIYANETDRRGDASFVIEEGAMLRDGQMMFYLPDTSKMQVRATVNDSKINRVNVGQKVLVRLDSDPEDAIDGEVRSVASYPLPRRWFQAPIEYEVIVKILNPSQSVRSGLRAKVEILTERIELARQAPISSIIPHENTRYVLVKGPSGVTAKTVKTGSNNDRFVIIEDGLDEGDEVLIDPESYRDSVEFPTSS